MAEHKLKTHPCYFEAVLSGVKTFEIRKNDRGFETGDLLILEEYIPLEGYTGRKIYKQICYLTTFEQKEDFVVLGMRDEGKIQ